MKICRLCELTKEESEFYGNRLVCKKCQIRQQAIYLESSDKIRLHIAFSRNKAEVIKNYAKICNTTMSGFIRSSVDDKILKIEEDELNPQNYLKGWLEQLSLLAWEYISEKGVLSYNNPKTEGNYFKLQKTQLWFIGLNIREVYDKLRGKLPIGAKMVEYAFHHEAPYRKHWYGLFISGEFIKNHKKGSINNA